MRSACRIAARVERCAAPPLPPMLLCSCANPPLSNARAKRELRWRLLFPDGGVSGTIAATNRWRGNLERLLRSARDWMYERLLRLDKPMHAVVCWRAGGVWIGHAGSPVSRCCDLNPGTLLMRSDDARSRLADRDSTGSRAHEGPTRPAQIAVEALVVAAIMARSRSRDLPSQLTSCVYSRGADRDHLPFTKRSQLPQAGPRHAFSFASRWRRRGPASAAARVDSLLAIYSGPRLRHRYALEITRECHRPRTRPSHRRHACWPSCCLPGLLVLGWIGSIWADRCIHGVSRRGGSPVSYV